MTDKPTAPDLAALSEAATQGVCFAQAPDTQHDFGVPIVATNDLATPTPTNGMVLWATMQPTEIDALNTAQAEANAAFAVALWNEYRAGRLVQIDEGMRERVAVAIQNIIPQWLAEDGSVNDVDLADAAIAAMMGGAK